MAGADASTCGAGYWLPDPPAGTGAAPLRTGPFTGSGGKAAMASHAASAPTNRTASSYGRCRWMSRGFLSMALLSAS